MDIQQNSSISYILYDKFLSNISKICDLAQEKVQTNSCSSVKAVAVACSKLNEVIPCLCGPFINPRLIEHSSTLNTFFDEINWYDSDLAQMIKKLAADHKIREYYDDSSTPNQNGWLHKDLYVSTDSANNFASKAESLLDAKSCNESQSIIKADHLIIVLSIAAIGLAAVKLYSYLTKSKSAEIHPN